MSTPAVHVCRAQDQPATDFEDHCVEPPMRFRFPHHRALWCFNCDKRRWAAHLIVHVHYDSIKFFCKEGHGCTVKAKRGRQDRRGR